MKKDEKLIVVNYVAKHSYPYVYKIVEAITKKNRNTLAIVSEAMPELVEWRTIEGLKIIAVKGYTSMMDFLPNMLMFKKRELSNILNILGQYSDVVVFNPIFTYWSYFVNRCLKDFEYIYVLHDPIPHNNRLILHNIFNKKLAKRAKKLVLLSEVFKSYTMKHYHRTSDDIVIIPEGSNVQIRRGSEIHLVEYKENIMYFLIQGRIDKYKGIDILAKAYRKLYEEYKNIALIVAGSGDLSPYRRELEGLENLTIINRWLTNEEVVGFYNDRNVIAVLPYISATQSGVINVAMPCKTPVIASDCGGIPEQIRDGYNGYLVKAGDVDDLYEKMKYILNHTDELIDIRNNAYRRIKALDLDTLASDYLRIILDERS